VRLQLAPQDLATIAPLKTMLEDVVERVRGHHTAVHELRDAMAGRAANTSLLQVESQLAALREAVDSREAAVRTALHQSSTSLQAAVALKLDERSTRDVVATMLSTFHAHFVPAPAAQPSTPTATLDIPSSPFSPAPAASTPSTPLPGEGLRSDSTSHLHGGGSWLGGSQAAASATASPSVTRITPVYADSHASPHAYPNPAAASNNNTALAAAAFAADQVQQVAGRVSAMESTVAQLHATLQQHATAHPAAVHDVRAAVQELRDALAATASAKQVREREREKSCGSLWRPKGHGPERPLVWPQVKQVAFGLQELSQQLCMPPPGGGLVPAPQMVLGTKVGNMYRCLSCNQSPARVSPHDGPPVRTGVLRGARSPSPPRSRSPLHEVRTTLLRARLRCIITLMCPSLRPPLRCISPSRR
jgi:hypothetical protein